jgi:hypothetical protein
VTIVHEDGRAPDPPMRPPPRCATGLRAHLKRSRWASGDLLDGSHTDSAARPPPAGHSQPSLRRWLRSAFGGQRHRVDIGSSPGSVRGHDAQPGDWPGARPDARDGIVNCEGIMLQEPAAGSSGGGGGCSDAVVAEATLMPCVASGSPPPSSSNRGRSYSLMSNASCGAGAGSNAAEAPRRQPRRSSLPLPSSCSLASNHGPLQSRSI